MPEDQNPYESPRTESLPRFAEPAAEVADLERRVAELEKRLARSWFLSPNLLRRIVAVWGYLLMGYVMILSVALPIMLLLDWLSNRGIFR